MIWFLLIAYVVLSFPAVNALTTWQPELKKELFESQQIRFLFVALWPLLINLALLGAAGILCLALAFALIRALLYLPGLVLAPAWDYAYFKMYPGDKENTG